jgi:condensation domain-containing protein
MHTATTKFDLSLGIEIHEKGLGIEIQYNTQLFERTTIQRMHRRYHMLIKYLMSNRGSKLTNFYEALTKSEETDEQRLGSV